MAPRKKGPEGKLAKSQVIGIRFDPKLRFAAELAAAKERRTLSSFIEWAVEKATKEIVLVEDKKESKTAYQVAESSWDLDEAEQFVKFAVFFPQFLTYDQQRLWKLVQENDYVWKGGFESNGEERWWNKRNADISDLIPKRLRERWETFKKVAEGKASEDALPKNPEPTLLSPLPM